MTKTRSTKNALISAILVLCMAFTGLLGTTFAWFTDSVTSSGNKIVAGTLKVDLELMDKNGNWKSLKRESAPIFESEKWEPGHTEVKILKVENEGSLALSWKTVLTKYSEISALAEVIDVYVRDYGVLDDAAASALTYPQDRNLAGYTLVGTAAEFLSTMEATTKGFLETGESAYLGLALKMRESADNKYQGLSLGGTFDITVLATQGSFEEDSFDETYDKNADWPFYSIDYTVKTALEEGQVDASGALTEEIPVGKADDQVSAVVPSGVKMADGATSLDLNVKSMEAPTVDLDLEAGESAKSIDVHIDGVAEDNTTPMLVTLRQLFSKGLNSTSVKLYHVENGTPVEMTKVALAELDAHNEYYYDVATGDVIMSVASFSEYTVVEDDFNRWEGEFDFSWYEGKTSPYIISNEEQLAGFGAIVDGGYKKPDGTTVTLTPDTFEGETVKLGADIDLEAYNSETQERISFNPIGFGYVNGTTTSGTDKGKSFMGIFDGQNHVIRNLYQNGWDIGLSYTNAGGGLFASVCNATIQNLTMVNADIVMECVEQGVIVGLAQGDCNFININIYGCSVANYQRATGGVVGEVSWGIDPGDDGVFTHTFRNINIDSTTVVGSLWGDFDAPVGGVIGGYWDDSSRTRVVMDTVNVACRLDVYNDVTSSYQWYSYRRAGMLIGNTDRATTTDGRTTASTLINGESYLTCSNVTVRYGDWRNYHYCEFTESSSSWPFVRVEAGENCTAFSNPRWGVPVYNGVKVTPENHPITEQTTHENGDDCMVLLQFNQLYGGGQGVYGEDEHTGVKTSSYAYTIQYVNDNKLLAESYVGLNTSESEYILESDPNYNTAVAAVKAWLESQGYEENEIQFGGWVNAASIEITEIPANNTKDVVLYPFFESPYTARFVDQQGNILAWCLFNDKNTENLSGAFAQAKENLPDPGEGFTLIEWKVKGEGVDTKISPDYTKWESFKSYKVDVTITPHYRYSGADLIEVIDELTGEIDHYQVAGYTDGKGSEIVEIPAYVNGKPVTTVNADAFSSYDHLHSIRIPGTVTEINSQSFTANNGTGRDTVTIYYEGNPETWNAAMQKYNSGDRSGMLKQDWDYYMGESSCVFFLDANGKVDLSKGYWELAKTGGFLGIGSKFEWQYHNHQYGGSTSGCNASEHNNKTNYTAECNCDLGKHYRLDAEYWTPATTTEE